jgi:aminoethylphosphonate catabolism LysR family transcriptional regulator
MALNVAHLRAFHAVATEGQFTTAARALGVTQPTMSSQVKALEQRFAVRLLVRGRRGVTLTPLGQRLFEVTRRYFSLEQEAAEILGMSRSLEAGYLRVGGDGPQHVVPAVSEFARRFPGVEVTLQMGNAESVMAMLADLRLDVAVVAAPGDDERFYSEPYRTSALVLFVAADHPWADRAEVRLRDLVSERLIVREPTSGTRQIFHRALLDAAVTPRAVMEIGSREAVHEAIAANLGVGVVAESEIRHDARVRIIQISDARLSITEYLVCLRERRRLGAVSAFVAIAVELADASASISAED